MRPLHVELGPRRGARRVEYRGHVAVRVDASLEVRVIGEHAEGVGEAAPFRGLSPDDDGDVLAALPESVPQPGSLADVSATVSRVTDASPAARFALETALLSWLAAHRSTHVTSLFSHATPVGVSGFMRAEGGLDAALELVASGARTLKIKARPEEVLGCVELAARIREAVEAPLHLRFDWNRGLGVAAARRALDALAPFDIQLVEEPSDDPLSLGPTAVPWALDESLVDPAVRARFERLGASAVVLKPTLLGGLFACEALAARAAAAGLERVVTHAFEGVVALAAVNVVALVLPGLLDSGLMVPHEGFVLRPEDEVARTRVRPW